MSLSKSAILVMTITFLATLVSMGANSKGTKVIFYDPNEIQPYISCLKSNAKPPLEYVMGLFETYDLVILSERTHPETTQWEFIYKLTSDAKFIESVGHIFTEYGSVSQQSSLENFMNTNNLEEKEVEKRVIETMRNFPIWPSGWSNNNIFDYLKKIYHLNQSLAIEKRVKIYFSDIPWKWEGMTKEDYDLIWKTEIPNRDKIMANLIISKFHEILESDLKRKKALVIMNTRHAYKTGGSFNTGDYIFKAFPQKTANVMFNMTASNFISTEKDYDQFTVSVPIQDGKWDTAFWMLGNLPLGFSFKHSPFGKDQFDLHPAFVHSGLTYEDVFTGMIFYQPLGKHMLDSNIPGYYDEKFKQTVLKRAKLKGDDEYYNRLVEMFNHLEANPNAWSKRKQYWQDKTRKDWCRLEFKIASDLIEPNTLPTDMQANVELTEPVKVDLAPGEILPSGEEIMERYIKQTGGREVRDKIKNRLIKGTIEIGQSKGIIIIYQAKPNKYYTNTEIKVDSEATGVATITVEQGTNSEVVWELNSMTGPRIMEGQEKALRLLLYNFDETNYQQLYDKIECVGVEKVEGKICYKVVQTPKQAEPITVYYSKDSGLAVKSTYILEQQLEKIKHENLTSNYKDVDGILYPHHIIQKVMNIDMHIWIKSIEHNIEISKDRFDPPDAIQKIL